MTPESAHRIPLNNSSAVTSNLSASISPVVRTDVAVSALQASLDRSLSADYANKLDNRPALIDVLTASKLTEHVNPVEGNLNPELFSDKVTASSYQFGRVGRLISVVGSTILPISSYSMIRIITDPPISVAQIHSRRETLAELNSNFKLKSQIEGLLQTLAGEKSSLLTGWEEIVNSFSSASVTSQKKPTLLQSIVATFRNFYRVFPTIGHGRKALAKALLTIAHLPVGNSIELKTIKDKAQSLIQDSSFKFIQGTTYATFTGVKTKDEIKLFTPRWPLNFGGFDILKCSALFLPTLAESFLNTSLTFPITIFSLHLVFIFRSRSIQGFIERLFTSKMREGLDIIGELDSLLTLSNFDKENEARGWKHASFTEGTRFCFSADKLQSPILALQSDTKVIPNDVELIGGRPLTITGPNSGGKTTISLSIFLTHLMSQLGLRIPSDRATLSVADKFLFQGPTFAGLDSEGRYGTELQATKDIMEAATPDSLVILDELAGGTSSKEQREMANYVIRAFARIENGLVIITHDHELAKQLSEQGVTATMQLALDDQDQPTYQVISGVATTSHAIKVAERIGFTMIDIEKIVSLKKNRAAIPPQH